MPNVVVRTIAAVALAPVVLAAIWFGPPYLAALLIVAIGVAAHEWVRLCAIEWRDGALLGYLTPPAAAIAMLFLGVTLGLTAVLVLAGLAVSWALLRRRMDPLWVSAGAALLGIMTIAVLDLRDQPAGRDLLFWMVGVIWASDIGGYAFGRTIGGPKLAPAISPNKTWAGLAGAIASAIVAGVAIGYVFTGVIDSALILLSAALAALAQAGDLFISRVKRQFGAKDTGTIIPGHGGVLDRIDGLLLAAPLTAAMTRLTSDLFGIQAL